MNLRKALPAALIGLVAVLGLGLVGMQTPLLADDSGQEIVKRDDDVSEVESVDDEDDDDTNDRSKNTRDTRDAATRDSTRDGTRDAATKDDTRDHTRD